MANYEPQDKSPDVYDAKAKEIFEYVLPELANSVRWTSQREFRHRQW